METNLFRYFYYRRRFPGLAVSRRANINVLGRFDYRDGVFIAEDANILVEPSGSLTFGNDVYLGRRTEVATDKELIIGSHTTIQDSTVILGQVSIGTGCLISYGVMASSGQHYFRLIPSWLIRDQDELARTTNDLRAKHHRAIIIEDDCWIGVHAVIMPGVTVGKGSVIGANSVITADVSPYKVVAGAPGKVIGERLGFVPPDRIDATLPQDRPYFYSGFDLRQASSKTAGGVRTEKCFCLALDGQGKRTITLNLKSLSGLCHVRFGEHMAEITQEWRDISFPVPSNATDRFRFEISSSEIAKPSAVVARAYVQ